MDIKVQGAADGPDFARVPLRLREKRRWIGWRWGTKLEGGSWFYYDAGELIERDGHLWHVDAQGVLTKAQKLPISVLSWKAASVSDPGTWARFDEALGALGRGLVDGLGYVLDVGEALVDLDGCISGGEISPLASSVIDKLDSYTEISVSGCGIHVITCCGDFRTNRGMKSPTCEVYAGGSTNRYATVSARALDGFDELNEDGEDALQAVYDDLFADIEPRDSSAGSADMDSIATGEVQAFTPEDEHDVAWMVGHYRWGFRLFAMGDYSGWARDRERFHPEMERSRSEADAALARYLVTATRGDLDRAHALFCASRMRRPKFDEVHDGRGGHTYSVMTIAGAARNGGAERGWENAIRRRDERLEDYPERLSDLVDLMKASDVTDPMLRGFMARSAPYSLQQSIRNPVEGYRPELVDWIIRNWPFVELSVYSFDFSRLRG